jgi:hypothetical protein
MFRSPESAYARASGVSSSPSGVLPASSMYRSGPPSWDSSRRTVLSPSRSVSSDWGSSKRRPVLKEETDNNTLESIKKRLKVTVKKTEKGTFYVDSYKDAKKILNDYEKNPDKYETEGEDRFTKDKFVRSENFIILTNKDPDETKTLTNKELQTVAHQFYINLIFQYDIAKANDKLDKKYEIGNLSVVVVVNKIKNIIEKAKEDIKSSINAENKRMLKLILSQFERALREITSPGGPTVELQGELQTLLSENITRLHNTYRKIRQYKMILGKNVPIQFEGWHRNVRQVVKDATTVTEEGDGDGGGNKGDGDGTNEGDGDGGGD